MESGEWCLVRESDPLSAAIVRAEQTALEAVAASVVKPSRNHKSTLLVSVIAVPRLDGDSPETARALRSVRKFRFTKPHRLFFHGWTELGLVIVDLSGGTVIASPSAKRLAKIIGSVLPRNTGFIEAKDN